MAPTRPSRSNDPAPDVAFVLPSFAGGGVERVVLNLLGALHAQGWRVELVLMQARGALLEQVPAGVSVVDLRAPYLGDAAFVTALPALTAYLRRRAPEVVYAGMTTVNLVVLWACWRAGVATRVVVSEHVPPSVNARTHPLKRPLPWLIRRFYPRADAIVAVASALADDLARVGGLPRDRVEVIHNPVVTPELLEQSRRTPDHPWFEDDVPVVLGIGRLVAQKDFATLLAAFAEVRRARPARLLVLGEGPDRAALEAQVARLGLADDVALPGFVPDPAAYLAHADVFAMSSVYEGLAVVLIEALACGCPVVSTDCLTGPDEILEGGRYGRLVPVGDAPALAAAILATLEAPPDRAELERRGADFTLEAIVPRYAALFDRWSAPGPDGAPRAARSTTGASSAASSSIAPSNQALIASRVP